MDGIKLILKSYGYEVTDEDVPVLEYLKQSVEQSILNECNIDTIPDALLYVVEKRTAGEFLFMKFGSSISVSDSSSAQGVVASVKEGDTTVSFNNPSNLQFTVINDLRKFGTEDVLKFRKISWCTL